MNEEEIIERIKDLLHTCDIGIEKHGEYDDLFKLDKEALQGLLDLYETEKIGNANLQILLDEEKEKNKEYERQLDLDYVDKNYISKDKIKELLNKAKKYIDGSYKDYEVLQVIYKGLQELLEERN